MNKEFVKCYDSELDEEYIGQLVTTHDANQANRFVRIVRVVRYPIQHALLFSDVASETPPFRYGDITILTVGEPVTISRYADSLESYQHSFIDALEKRLAETQRRSERNILTRHMNGDIRKVRKTIKYFGG